MSRYTVKAATPAETPGRPYWFVVDTTTGERVAGGYWRAPDAWRECERRNDVALLESRGLTVVATVEPTEGEELTAEDEDAMMRLMEGGR